MGHGMMACGPDVGPAPTVQRAAFHQGHKEPLAPSPPRAVASLSVRVLGQPDHQGLPPAVSRAQEKEGTAPSEPGSAHPVLHLSRSAGVLSGGRVQEDSNEDDDGDDDSEDDDDWGPGPGPGGAKRANRVPPPLQQMPPSGPAASSRSKRKLQPPQHIPPPQVLETPMQLRHPTPPPSPPHNLFPLPDTPKQSPPDNQEGEDLRVASVPPPTMQRQDSDSSSRSSSPEPPVKRRPGPLSLLVHKMESEGAFRAGETASAVTALGETAHSSTGSVISVGASGPSESPLQILEKKRQQENKEKEEERRLAEKRERERQKEQEEERKKEERERENKRVEEEKEKERKRLQEEEERRKKRQLEEEREKRQQVPNKERMSTTKAQDSGSSSDSDSKSDSSSCSSQSSSSAGEKPRPAKQLKVSDQDL